MPLQVSSYCLISKLSLSLCRVSMKCIMKGVRYLAGCPMLILLCHHLVLITLQCCPGHLFIVSVHSTFTARQSVDLVYIYPLNGNTTMSHFTQHKSQFYQGSCSDIADVHVYCCVLCTCTNIDGHVAQCVLLCIYCVHALIWTVMWFSVECITY